MATHVKPVMVFVEKTTVDDIGFLPLVNNSLVIILVHLNHPRKKLTVSLIHSNQDASVLRGNGKRNQLD